MLEMINPLHLLKLLFYSKLVERVNSGNRPKNMADKHIPCQACVNLVPQIVIVIDSFPHSHVGKIPMGIESPCDTDQESGLRGQGVEIIRDAPGNKLQQHMVAKPKSGSKHFLES